MFSSFLIPSTLLTLIVIWLSRSKVYGPALAALGYGTFGFSFGLPFVVLGGKASGIGPIVSVFGTMTGAGLGYIFGNLITPKQELIRSSFGKSLLIGMIIGVLWFIVTGFIFSLTMNQRHIFLDKDFLTIGISILPHTALLACAISALMKKDLKGNGV